MNLKSSVIIGFVTVVLIAISSISVRSDQQWFGGPDDVAFAKDLWSAMQRAGLVGKDAKRTQLRVGTHPHGAILESSMETITVNDVTSTLVIKHSYRGNGVTIEQALADPATFLEDITVMFKREEGYDTANQNWFWAKYNADGSLDATPNGVQLGGRVAKGKPKGCIACHSKAFGNDYLFVK